MLELSHVTKSFGDVSILEDVTYTFPNRGLVCLMGPSGSGKTTLLNLVAGFDSDYRGTIRSCGRDLSQLDRDGLAAYRRDCVGFVFQNYHLLPGYSVVENVLLPAELTGDSREESRAEAEDLLRRLGLGEKLHQPVETLSGGQKQRVAIARALMGDPRLILADEPTGALDRETTGEIMALLKELAEDRLVVVITHDAKVCGYADQVLYIRDKTIISEGPAPDREKTADEMEPPARGGRPSPRRRAARNFRVHLGRYLAAALAISVGLLAFLGSLSFDNVIAEEIRAFQEKNTVFNNGYVKGADDGTLLALLGEDPRVENAYYQYKLNDISLTLGGHTETLAEKFPLPRTTETLSYGVMPRRGAGEIAVTPSLAKKFSANIRDLLGQTVTLTWDGVDYPLTVSGIYNAGYDDFFISSDVERQLYEGLPQQENYSLSYDVASFQDVAAVDQLLTEAGYSVQNAAAEAQALQTTFRNLDILFRVISLLVLALALFLCVFLLVKLQNSRYRELGLLAALGFRGAEIRAMVQWENLFLALFSAAITCALTALAAALCRLLDFPLNLRGGQIAASVAAAFVLITAISTLASARLIRTEPAVALKK